MRLKLSYFILIIILIFSISLNLIFFLKNSSLANKYNNLLAEIAKSQFEKNTHKKDISEYKKGDYLPDFIFKTFNNSYIDLSEIESKYLLLIYFKFSDCDLCYAYLMNAQRNISFYNSKGIKVVGITDQNKKIINDFINKKNITLPIALDRDKKFKFLVNKTDFTSFRILINNKKEILYIDENPPGYDDDKEIDDIINNVRGL